MSLRKSRSGRLLIRSTVALMAIGLALPCHASGSASGNIQNLSFGSDGYVWFSHCGTRNGSLPACAEANGLWIINGGTAQGQVVVSALITAASKHQMISIQGTGSCDHNHETIGYVVLVD